MVIAAMTPEMARWRAEAEAEPSSERTWSVPLHVLFGEAIEVARFHATYWEPTTGEGARRGLASAAGPGAGKPLLHAATGEQIQSLVRASQDAHARYLLSVDHEAKSPAERGRVVLREIRSTLAYLFDDGIEDQEDARLARFVHAHAKDPETLDALALALESFAAFADLHRDAMDGLGGFSVALLDEARTIAAALRARPRTPVAASPETVAALAFRNRLLRLLMARLNAVRAAARFVYRDEPAIARQATSAYERRRRAERRRSKAPRVEATRAVE